MIPHPYFIEQVVADRRYELSKQAEIHRTLKPKRWRFTSRQLELRLRFARRPRGVLPTRTAADVDDANTAPA
jgi:hypothetical protein